jgi:hypothetical protein
MITYKLNKSIDGVVMSVNRSDGWSIPINENNTDYQAYLKWLDEGNTPLPAENN